MVSCRFSLQPTHWIRENLAQVWNRAIWPPVLGVLRRIPARQVQSVLDPVLANLQVLAQRSSKTIESNRTRMKNVNSIFRRRIFRRGYIVFQCWFCFCRRMTQMTPPDRFPEGKKWMENMVPLSFAIVGLACVVSFRCPCPTTYQDFLAATTQHFENTIRYQTRQWFFSHLFRWFSHGKGPFSHGNSIAMFDTGYVFQNTQLTMRFPNDSLHGLVPGDRV